VSKAKTLEELTPQGLKIKLKEESNERLIAIAKDILSEDTPITMRRLHYLLVSDERAVNECDYVNTLEQYRALDRLTAKARKKFKFEQGYISPLCFVDETRTTVTQSGWSSLSSFAKVYSDGFFNYDMWQNQPRMVEVIIEKDGLLSVLGPTCAEHQVYLRSIHGQTSITLACDIARRFSESPAKRHTVLYGGDHDPSGYTIEDTLRDRITYFARHTFDTELKVEWLRWGLLEDDFTKHRIASIEPKQNDTNLAGFYTRFGENAEFAEIDSLPTQELIDRVSSGIESCKDADQWQADLETQTDCQKKLKKALSKLI
jgi:hypothetical protein